MWIFIWKIDTFCSIFYMKKKKILFIFQMKILTWMSACAQVDCMDNPPPHLNPRPGPRRWAVRIQLLAAPQSRLHLAAEGLKDCPLRWRVGLVLAAVRLLLSVVFQPLHTQVGPTGLCVQVKGSGPLYKAFKQRCTMYIHSGQIFWWMDRE